MEEGLNKEWLENILTKCSWLNDSSDPAEHVQDLQIDDAVPKGFNYAGRLLRLRAVVQHRSGKTRQISAVLKLNPLSQDQCDFMSEHGLFTTETTTYDEVLTKMEQLMADSGMKRELDWPKHFTVNKENSLLLEDLKESCYATIRQREASYEEGLIAAQAIGRFHALSHVLIDQGSIDINNYKVNNMVESDTIIEFVYITSLKGIIDAIRTTRQNEWFIKADLIESKLSKLGPALKELMKKSSGGYNILNHGDCWPNNVMFKYSKDTNEPTGIKLIDFQLCYYSSFAWDLVHFLYCAYLVDRRESFKHKFISEYRRSLIQSLQQLRSRDLKVPSLEDMVIHMERISLFGLLVAVSTTPRLIPGISLDLDLDITLPDHAHRTKTAIFSMPQVFRNITVDLEELYKIMINF